MSSFVRYTGDGATLSYAIPFDYILDSHVQVSINGVPATQGAHYDLVGSSVVFTSVTIPFENADIEIRRLTPVTALVTYQDGAVLTAEDLNTATRQAIFAVEEIRDYYEYQLEQGFARLNNGEAVPVQEAIDAAVQSVLGSSLLADLQNRYSDIDANGEAILTQAAIINNLAQASAATVFVQTSEPVPGVGGVPDPIPEGARWYDSDDNNHPYIYLSGSWADLEDPRIGANEAAVTALEATVNNPTTGVAASATAIDALETLVYDGSQGNVALASSLTTLTTTVGDNTASITTQATSINGLEGQYTVKVDVNGRVAGFGLANTAVNGTPTSEFVVLADSFAIVDPAASGGTPTVPFVVTGGTTYIQDVVVQDAVIADLTVGKLTTGTFTNTFNHNGDLSVGTQGKIRGGKTDYATGTGFFLGYHSGNYKLDIGDSNRYMRWDGTSLELAGANITIDDGSYQRLLGTNVASTYIDWFGPVGTVNDANASFYIKKSGDAYFGGNIKAEYRPIAWIRYAQTSNTTFTTVASYGCSVGVPSSTGSGRARITFSTTRPSTNYVVVGNGQNAGGSSESDIPNVCVVMPYYFTTSYFTVSTKNASNSGVNPENVHIIVFAPD